MQILIFHRHKHLQTKFISQNKGKKSIKGKF